MGNWVKGHFLWNTVYIRGPLFSRGRQGHEYQNKWHMNNTGFTVMANSKWFDSEHPTHVKGLGGQIFFTSSCMHTVFDIELCNLI